MVWSQPLNWGMGYVHQLARTTFLWLLLIPLVAHTAPQSAGQNDSARHAADARLIKIKVHVKDERGRTIKDLRQDEFILQEDEREQVITWWKKSSEFGRVRYQLGYVPSRERTSKTHQIQVRVKRPGAVVQFSPKNVQ